MADNIEQPADTSPAEVNTQYTAPQDPAPEVAAEAAPEAPAPAPAPKGGAKERIAHLVSERNAERQARLEYERKVAEYERQLAAYQQSQAQAQADPYADDPFMQRLRAIEARQEAMARDTAYAKDMRAREEFWRQHDFVSDDVVEAVETQLEDFRSRGLDKIRREDLLAYQIGSRELPNLQRKVKQPAATPSVNRVAVVEGGSTAPKSSGSKSPEDMTLAELREWMKGKTF